MLANLPIFHVLLVDDDEDDFVFFTEAVKNLPYRIKLSFAENGEILLKFLDKEKLPDIIFLDLNMPGKNGKECLNVIRSNHTFDKLPIIIYSTSNEKTDIDSCYNGKANFYVVKPSSISRIRQVVEDMLMIDWKGNSSAMEKENFVLKI